MEEKMIKSADYEYRLPVLKNLVSPKQTYHLEPEYGLLNDPVGLIQFHGVFHVFFQWNSKAKDHSNKEWGHFSSKDLLHWTWHDSPLKPGEEYDLNGVYSGSSVCWKDQIYAYYTGNRKQNGIRSPRQCLAISTDGIQFVKQGSILDKPDVVTGHFRDPKVWVENNQLNMLIGAQNKNLEGMILSSQSKDGRTWSPLKMTGLTRKANMIECPDLLQLNDEKGRPYEVMLYCLQHRNPVTDDCLKSYSVYRVLEKGWKAPLDLDQGWQYLDAGFDSFAAQSFKAEDGRTLLLSWMNRLDEDQERLLADAAKSIHCLTLPREISIKNGKLIQKPAREMRKLFSKTGLTIQDGLYLKSRAWMAQIEASNQGFDFAINTREAVLSWVPESNLLTLYRWDWAKDCWQSRSLHLPYLKSVQIFMDTSSLEIFLNEGQEVLSARILPSTSSTTLQTNGLDAGALQLYPAVTGRFKLYKEFQKEGNAKNQKQQEEKMEEMKA